ncbi:hypothetical protein [Streptomyces sp. NPDC054874]
MSATRRHSVSRAAHRSASSCGSGANCSRTAPGERSSWRVSRARTTAVSTAWSIWCTVMPAAWRRT